MAEFEAPGPPPRRSANPVLLVLAVVAVVVVSAGMFVMVSGDDEASSGDETTSTTQPDDTSDQRAQEPDADEPAEISEADVQALLEGVWFTEDEVGLPFDPDSPSRDLETPTFNFCGATDGGGDEQRLARAEASWLDLGQRPVFNVTVQVVAYDSEQGAAAYLDAFAAVPDTCRGEDHDYAGVMTGQVTSAISDGSVDGSVGFHMDGTFTDGTWAKFFIVAIPQERMVATLYVGAADPSGAETGAAELAPIVAQKLEQASAAYGG